MRIVTYVSDAGERRAGLVVNDHVVDLAESAASLGTGLPSDVTAILRGGSAALDVVQQVQRIAEADRFATRPLSTTKLTAAIPAPQTIYLLAANYQSHITESGAPPVDKHRITPRLFMKPGSAVIGTGDPIVIPLDSNTVDYEIEIAAVIGTGGKHIPEESAEQHVAGYVIFNDISARDLSIAEGRMKRDGDWFFDWLLGKWCDTFAAIGPMLVTRDEIGDPTNLEMSLYVNGELRQHSSAGEMIFTVPEAIAFLSRFVTLRPGDMICMGTPGGVGATTATYLRPGDEVVATIECLGTLVNPVIAGEP